MNDDPEKPLKGSVRSWLGLRSRDLLYRGLVLMVIALIALFLAGVPEFLFGMLLATVFIIGWLILRRWTSGSS